jgi:hypothetical protein
MKGERGAFVLPARRLTMPLQSRHPGLINALHLFWLFVLIMTPVVISRLLYAAFE